MIQLHLYLIITNNGEEGREIRGGEKLQDDHGRQLSSGEKHVLSPIC